MVHWGFHGGISEIDALALPMIVQALSISYKTWLSATLRWWNWWIFNTLNFPSNTATPTVCLTSMENDLAPFTSREPRFITACCRAARTRGMNLAANAGVPNIERVDWYGKRDDSDNERTHFDELIVYENVLMKYVDEGIWWGWPEWIRGFIYSIR